MLAAFAYPKTVVSTFCMTFWHFISIPCCQYHELSRANIVITFDLRVVGAQIGSSSFSASTTKQGHGPVSGVAEGQDHGPAGAVAEGQGYGLAEDVASSAASSQLHLQLHPQVAHNFISSQLTTSSPASLQLHL